ncbi:hypothetical protein HHI36_005183 [Cryptolaemus montrouzieri]|uniref:Uncharacterized protein n=1 Tax=Cryptolaemus montrouzieri TaxID=559131 RepID=A0ABD2NTL8_9CUCU
MLRDWGINQFNYDILFIDNPKWFRNLTNIEIPKDISNFLSLGPNFGIKCTNKKVNSINKLLTDVENIIDEISLEHMDGLKAETTNIITNYINNPNNEKRSILESRYKKTELFLESHPGLCIMQSDMRNCSGMMESPDYIVYLYQIVRRSYK